MAKQLNVDMRFNADTTKAKQAITDLEQSLQKLGHSTMPKNTGIDPAQFEKASAAARELEFHLKNAYNAKTGNLDLSKLSTSLQQSGTNLSQLTSGFSKVGQIGQQAFVNLARAIATADQPSLTLNTHLATMWTTLKNVARFQISSSIMHGLIGGIQTAYGYAQDLNKSLNNIRIVTGQSTDQMARFAEQANKGARALSSTTLDYTDAALIYYQQGLSNEEVVARTETTLKLANVSRQSAEEVSSQMTAIWNNFAEGSENLEYYADVITKLGATTAASSDEIANGVSKFAAIAQTVGLSYEYAASALATIVAETRQSEDAVGNGLRTLFARFEGLKLGETLEDGVDLNKYSKALKAIGVNVLDANGNLREMDDILDDMGSKWDTLNKAQQVALAQTVGGVRQYTNLIALMDNWDKFQVNVETARNSEGTVNEQAEAYAEGWEGARDRVKAATESIFQALLDDKFFIGITNAIEHILVGIRSFIDGMGGLKGILFPVLGFAFTMISNKIDPAIQKIIQDIQILSGHAHKVYEKTQKDTSLMITQELNTRDYNKADEASLRGSNALLIAKTKLSGIEDKLSASEKMRADLAISGIQKEIESNEKLGAEIDKLNGEIKSLKDQETELTAKAKEELEIEKEKYQIKIDNMHSKIESKETELSTKGSGLVNDAAANQVRNTFDNIAGSDEQLNIRLQNVRDKAIQVSQEIQQSLAQAFVEDKAVNFGQVVSDAFTKAKLSMSDFQSNQITSENLEIYKDKLKLVQSSLGDLRSYAPEIEDQFRAAFNQDDPEKFHEKVQEIFNSLKNLDIKDTEKLAKAFKIKESDLKSYTKLKTELDELKRKEQELIKQQKNLKTEGTKSGKELSKITDERIKKEEELRQKGEQLKKQMSDTNAEAERLNFSHIMGAGEIFTTISGGLMQIGSSIMSVRSLINAWNNDDLTFGEKITQSLMSVGMVVPSIMGIMSKIVAIRDDVANRHVIAAAKESAAEFLVAGATRAAKGAMTQEQQEKLKSLIMSGALTAALDKEGNERTEAIAKILLENGIATEENATKMAGVIASMLSAKGKNVESGARWKNVAAILAEKAANIEIYAIIAAIVIILAALAAAIYFAVKAWNADAEAAKQAAKDQETATEAYENAKTAYKELMDTITGYKEAEEAISHLTKGTQEWKDAVTDLNNEVLDLIQKYPELAQYVDDSGDYLKISEEGLQYLQNMGDRNLSAARQNQLAASVRANDAANNASYTEVGRGISYKTGEIVYTESGSYEETAVASNADMRKAVEAYNNTNGNLSAEALRAVGITNQGLINALLANQNAIRDLATSVNNNTKANNVLTDQMAREVIEQQNNADNDTGNDFDLNHKYADEVMDVIGNRLATEAESNRKKWESDSDQGVSWTVKNKDGSTRTVNYNAMSDEDMQKEYAEMMGWDISMSEGIENKSGYGIYHMTDGSQMEVSDEAARYALNYARFMEEQGASAQQLLQAFTELSAASNEVSAGLGDVMVSFAGGEGGDFSKANDRQMADLEAQMSTWAKDENGNFNISDDTDDPILKHWKALGYESANAYAEALQNASEQYHYEEELIGKDLPEKAKAAFESIDLSEATLEQKQKVSAAIRETFAHLGSEGAELLSQVLSQAIKDGIDPDIITDALNQIDWTAPDALGQLQTILEEQGVDIDLTDPAWQLLIQRMQEAERTAASLLGRFDALRSSLNDLSKITNNIEFGKVISDEDYQNLLKYNKEIADLFIMTADGWKFVGDVDKLNEYLEGSTADVGAFKQEFQEANEAGEFLNNNAQYDFAAGENKSTGKAVSNNDKMNALQSIQTSDAFGTIQKSAGISADEWTAIKQSTAGYYDEGVLDYEEWAKDNAQYAEEVQRLWTEAGKIQQNYNDGLYDSAHQEEMIVDLTAKSVQDLDDLYQAGEISAETYQKTLKTVLQRETEAQGLNWDEVVDYADYLRNDLLKSMNLTEEQAIDLAAKQKLLDRGFKTLKDSTGDFYKLLDAGQQGTTEYRTALKKMQDGLMDIIGATGSKNLKGTMFDDKFFEENRETIEKAAEGDIEAIEALQTAAAKQVVLQMDIDDSAKEEVNGIIDDMQAAIPDDIKIGTSIGEIEGMDGYLDSLNQMLASGQLTADQVNAILESIGFDPEIEYEKIPISEEQAETIRAGQSVEVDGRVISASAVHELHTGEELYVTIPKINAKGTKSTGAPKSAGGGGGGGGGGGKNKQKEKKDPTDERDRYHTITQKIQDATDAYDELSKAEDRAFGKERIKAMEGITNNLKLQIELQKQYLDEIRNYLEGDRAAVEALGATFDANGVITNYDDLIAELVAKYNEGVDIFNEGGLDEDAFKEQYEEPFNDAKEAIDQYVETINLLQSEELNLIDLQNDLADQFREIAAYKLELHIDIDEDELKYLDFLLEMLGENAEDAVDRLDLLGQQFNTNRDEIAAYTTAIQDLLRLRGFTDEDVAAFIRGELTAGDLEERGFTTDDIDKLREYRDAIQDNTTAMNDLAKEIEESFLNTLDDLNDKVDDAEERFEHFAAMLEHFHNVVDIVGQDALGMSAETMKLLAKAAKENAIEMVKAAKTQLDSLNTVRAQAQAQLDAALEAQKNASTAEEKLRADEAVRYWSDTISEVTNRVEQAEEDLADALENALEGIQEMYTTMIEQATKEFERSVTGAAGSLEQLQKNFDRQKETQELYIPTYEKIYELTKLTRDINNSIDDTDNLWSKQELAKLQDEINQKMEDGVELTEHDVEELRKRYELKLAEAALEEAQDAKRTVRMSRDNEGNWSYVYTADENDVAAAEQNYEDKLYEYQQMNYQYIQDLQANIIQAQQDMVDAINDLDATSFASQEEYLAEVQRIRDAAMAKISQYRDQLAQTLDQQGILYEEDWKRYNELTGYRMARDDQWVDNWNETILAQETGFETLEGMFDQITGAIGGPDEPGTYVGDITDAYAEMQASNERALNAAGTSMQTYEQDVTSAVNDINEEIEDTQNEVEEFSEKMTDMMKEVTDFIGTWKEEYGNAVKDLTKFNEDLYASCQKLITALQQTFNLNAEFEASQSAGSTEGGPSGSTRGGNNTGNGNTGNGNTGTETGPEPGGQQHNYSESVDNKKFYSNDVAHWNLKEYKDNGVTYKTEKVGVESHDWRELANHSGYVCEKCHRRSNFSTINLKSGGYTGTWSMASGRSGLYTGSWNGPDLEENGRLAFLHQKELVLNASDTENFLSAVDMVRQISQTIDLQAASRSNGLNFLLPDVLDRGPDTLDQNVHIEAHFPNVTSHSEIEEAFTNLVGKASQFANR